MKVIIAQDWLLLAIDDGIGPIKLQKALFLFSQESGAPAGQKYEFVPYNWGAMSAQIYDDLGKLRDADLVKFEPSGRGWNDYRLTSTGKQRALQLRGTANQELVAKLNEVCDFVQSRDFEKLLEDVYEKYPSYATKSLFRR